jgi:DNA-binding protein HU-beta
MNKAELIDNIAQTADISKTAADSALKAVIDGITSTLMQGNPFQLVGFGTFVVRERAARTGRNPRTGETLQIKASKVAGFKPGKALKDALQK